MNKITWLSPSNIALVKYWGKHANQLPNNPSLSLTLSKCFTKTTVEYKEADNFSCQFYFENKREKEFEDRIKKYLLKIEEFIPYTRNLELVINSENSFPHSTGIASSASSMSALALCLCSMEKEITGEIHGFDSFYKKASFLARLGSGSASRSLFGEYVAWGENDEHKGSSDYYAYKIDTVHKNFQTLQDTVLIVSSKKKTVSSSSGHKMMGIHPFAKARYLQASQNWLKLKNTLAEGDYEQFIEIIEEEALSLHAMMMTSAPGYILMHPDTIRIIDLIREFRKTTNIPVCFTLDAGPNVHVLYPFQFKNQVLEFIENNLVLFCENRKKIDDAIGQGPFKQD